MTSTEDAFLPALTGTLPLPIWAVGAVIVLFIVVIGIALMRAGSMRTLSVVGRYVLVVLGVLIAWTFLDRVSVHERAAERRALDARAMELTARAIAPGSALACVDGSAGETVSASCEKAVFASPESVAAGVAYVSAQLSLLADGLDYVNRSDANYEISLVPLQRAIELDRFGFVAHVLAVRDRCTPDNCESFAMLRDASRVRANLVAQTFQRFVGRNAIAWTGNGSPTGQGGQAEPSAQSAPVAGLRPQVAPSTTNIEFPSAASIPPVSIMNAEPALPAAPPAPGAGATPSSAAAGEPGANAPAPRRPPPAVRRPAPTQQQGTAPPVQLTPQPPEANASPQTRAQ